MKIRIIKHSGNNVLTVFLLYYLFVGETFFYLYGTQSRLYTPEPELAKEVLSTKFGSYEKNKPRPLVIALMGNGLVFLTGLQWVKHRKIVSPVFNVDKLKVKNSCQWSYISLSNDLYEFTKF